MFIFFLYVDRRLRRIKMCVCVEIFLYHIATHLVVVLFVVDDVVLVGAISLKKPKSDQDEIWHICSLSKYALIDRVGFLIWRHTFKMAAMTSFHASDECIHSVCPALCSSVHQCLIHSTFVFVRFRIYKIGSIINYALTVQKERYCVILSISLPDRSCKICSTVIVKDPATS